MYFADELPVSAPVSARYVTGKMLALVALYDACFQTMSINVLRTVAFCAEAAVKASQAANIR